MLSMLMTLCLTPVGRLGAAEDWQRAELANGAQLLVLEVPGAPRQSTFTFVPVGLDSDGPGRAQFSHLMEHMILRTTDPDGLFVDGVQLNGETTSQCMRLETFTEPDRWSDALVRHVRWWYARDFDATVLEREKGRIQQELLGTTQTGYTHKWSVAAWRQAIAGRNHAAVRGDVEQATVEDVREQVTQRVHPEDVVLVCVGPAALESLVETLEQETLAVARGLATATDAPEADHAVVVGPTVTWDLETSHALEWYEVPYTTAADRAALQVLAGAANVALQRAVRLRARGVNALAFAASMGGKGYVLLSAASSRGELPEAWAAEWSAVRDLLSEFNGIELLARQMAMQLDVPDFAAQRRLFGSRPGAELIEAQSGMNVGYAETRTAMPFSAAAQTWRELEPDDLVGRAQRCFHAENRASTVLRPVGDS